VVYGAGKAPVKQNHRARQAGTRYRELRRESGYLDRRRAPTSLTTWSLQVLAPNPKHLAEKILTSRNALEGERKQVTVLFADVKGSMDLAEQVDPEEWHKIMDRFFAILSDGVHRFEGTVNQYTGDGIMALFATLSSWTKISLRLLGAVHDCFSLVCLEAELLLE